MYPDPEKSIQLYEAGASYLIGDLAFTQGYAPYRKSKQFAFRTRLPVTGPKLALLVASGAKSGELVLTTGFPYTTNVLYKLQAIDFLQPRIFIEFNADTYSTNAHKRIQLTIVILK